MAAQRFHVNPETGNPGVCRAKKQCRFGDIEADHYDSPIAAAKAFEERVKREEITGAIKELQSERASLNEALENAWRKVQGRIGFSYELNIPREDYDELRAQYAKKALQLDELRAKLRGEPIKPWVPNMPAAIGLEEAQKEFMTTVNQVPDYSGRLQEDEKYYFTKDIEKYYKETQARYFAGEELEDPSGSATPGDKLLAVLKDPNNGLMGTQQVYAALVFPEKDLAPILERLNVTDVSVAFFDNNREQGLVYSVVTPAGDVRSFSVYEHRNTDSYIINGATNWDRAEAPHGPYAADSKYAYFSKFAPGSEKQVAETLGYFLKSAQTGELESDEDLAKKAEHRDWHAILSETIPGYSEWAEQNGYKKSKRWFE